MSKQLDKIGEFFKGFLMLIFCSTGVTLSTVLVNAGYTTFDKLLEANPRELELVVNRHPPFGNQVYLHYNAHITTNHCAGKGCSQEATSILSEY